MTDIAWGIIGPGRIAHQFARGLATLDDHRLLAVASRDHDRAATFADAHGADRAYDDLAALLDDPAIDAVYIATPHPAHHPTAIAALSAGKAVLCEKPLCVNAAQVRDLIARSKATGAFLMEAMWTRFLPAMIQAQTWYDSGAVGAPRLLQADFCFRCDGAPSGRLMDPTLAGGGLLDVGVYCVALAERFLGGDPLAWQCQAHLGDTGIDEQAGILGRWPGGALALLSSGVRTASGHQARIDGDLGHIVIPRFWRAERAELHVDGQDPVISEHPIGDAGYSFEAAEVGRCLRAGLRESPGMSHASSLRIAELLDDCRRQIGLSYPCDKDTL